MTEQHQTVNKQDPVPENATNPQVEDDSEDLDIFPDAQSRVANNEAADDSDDEEGADPQGESNPEDDSGDDSQDDDGEGEDDEASEGENADDEDGDDNTASELEQLKANLKAAQDKFASTNGELIDLSKATAQLVKALEDDGTDRSRIAKLAGISEKQVDAILNGERVKVHASEDPLTAKANLFDEQYGQVKKTLDSIHGEDTEPLVVLFTEVMRHDKSLSDEFINHDGDMVSFVVKKGQQLRDQYGSMEEGMFGAVKSLKQENEQLKKQLEQLQGKAQASADSDDDARQPAKRPEQKGRPAMRGGSPGAVRPQPTDTDLSDIFQGR